MVNKTVGKHIRQYRRLAGLNQEDLAEMTSLSVIAISNIERGVNYPAFDNFIAIANALNVSADALLEDVIDASYEQKATVLSEMLAKADHNKRTRILKVIETLLNEP